MEKNKWAFITGATAGIGKACAFELAKHKLNLVICGRRKSRLEDIKDELEKCGVKVLCLSFDIQNKDQTMDVLNSHQKELELVSVVINNAGLAKGIDPIDQGHLDDWDQMIDTNIKGLLYVTRFFAPILKKHPRADIINIGSVSGRWTYPGGAVYCGTKHAVRAISEGMRQDLLGSNIKVCCLEPGLCETEFSIVRLNDEQKAKMVYENIEALNPQDIADCISWIVNRPKHVNIQELVIYPVMQASVTHIHRD